MSVRYWKVIRDLTSDKARTLLLVIALAIGVFGVGTILSTYSVLSREMTANYRGTNPASATIEMEQDITPGLLDSVKLLPGIRHAERHATITARMQINGRWHPLLLFVIDDFYKKKLNQFNKVSGPTIPPVGTMLVERTAYVVMQAKEGDSIQIKTPNGSLRSIVLSGTVHDPGLAPAWQEQAGYGYITAATLHWLGESQNFDQLRIKVIAGANSRQHITQQAKQIAGMLTQKGYAVHEIQVPPPGKHPHQSQMNAVLWLFIAFSGMLLILASILVATSMAMLMVKQVRQIGVMKTIGARSTQITGLYFLMMLLLCTMALLIGIPSSYPAAAAFYSKVAVLLNLEITDHSIPAWVTLIQIACGILIPMLITAFPVLRGSRISVKQAMNNYGVSIQKPPAFKNASVLFFSERFTLSLRNVFRQRGRLITTLGLLAAGGAVFMTALNVSEAWNTSLKKIYSQRLYDQDIRLQDYVQADALISAIKNTPGVRHVEGWSFCTTSPMKGSDYSITGTYPDKGHGSFMMQALPIPTQLIKPTITEGHWLSNSTSNEVVLNQGARSNTKIGDEVLLSVDGITTKWKVVGFSQDVGNPSTAYVSQQAFAQQTNTAGMINLLRIAYTDRSKDFAFTKNREIEALLERAHITARLSIPVSLLRDAIAGHMKVLVNSLIAMGILMALVGLLGLMSTTGMNVMERTREIGVMRAIGATPATIRNLIVWEGLSIGLMSMVLAFAIALVLSFYMGRFLGAMSFRTPLSLTVSWTALLIWLAIIVGGSYIATLLPARRANKITTREALAYE
jgi:putative ABC transport system permease protein